MTGLLKLIKERQSSRTPFDEKKTISKENILKIIEAGSWAPTAHNMQNFEVVLVDDKRLLNKISDLDFPASLTFIQENYLQLSFSEDELKKKRTGVLSTMFPRSWLTPNLLPEKKEEKHSLTESHHQMLSCPTLVIILYDPSRRAPASEGDFLGTMSIGCVLENMWLMAASLGIGFHVVSSLSNEETEKKIREMMGIPKHLRIAISFRLGYPFASSNYLRVRRDVNSFLHHNKYGELGLKLELKNSFKEEVELK